MKFPVLKDLEKVKDLNKPNNFSAYSYVFQSMKLNGLNSDLYFCFLKLFWPEFINYKGFIVLKEMFSEEKIEDLINRDGLIEYWMNVFLVDSYFEEDDDKPELFAKALVELWEIKLKKDFPTHNLEVKLICDDESGDYGLTFYQIRN